MAEERAAVKVFPEEITIENFKSIRRLTLRPRPGVNVLVGPNMAGKTNVLEAVYFFARALSQAELLKTPYLPHLPQYWSPEDLFFMRRIEDPMGFELLSRVGDDAWEDVLQALRQVCREVRAIARQGDDRALLRVDRLGSRG
ncbi:MAG: hypothetical protein AT711_07430 [Thermoproteus sp. CIS_19]|nr:MAG: hypothetical protein AT711_07430 [Thermoproteus sp. CIS_19]